VKQIEKRFPIGVERERIRQAFIHNTRPWHSIFRKSPIGWTSRGRNRLKQVITEANQYVQRLNDTFTDPSGHTTPEQQPAVVKPPEQPQHELKEKDDLEEQEDLEEYEDQEDETARQRGR
jgi:hypothetical protein